jgi:hypothetical protein
MIDVTAYENLEDLNEKEFKLITGVTRGVFHKMLDVLRKKYAAEHARGGRPGLPVEIRLTLALEYWREYRSFRHMAVSHQIKKSTVNEAVLWVENVLSESEEFKLQNIRERFKSNEENEGEIAVVLIDVEEQPIERPKYDQEKSYSGKKTSHREIPNSS